jgi:hypothetical protein
MKKMLLGAAALALLAACAPPATKKDEAPAAPPPVVLSEAEAMQIADKVSAAMATGDSAQIMANYVPDAVAFSMLSNDLITTEAADKADTDAIVKLQPKATLNARKIQVFDADTFVDSAVITLDVVRNGKPTWFVARVTDVYQKQADGSWKIVTEHASPAPQPLKTRLAPLAGAENGAAAPDTPPLGSVRPSATTQEAPVAPTQP